MAPRDDPNPAHGVTVVMPAFNEGEGIAEFTAEIAEAFSDRPLSIVVVDDASTDDTAGILETLAGQYPLIVAKMDRNAGHGPATLAALSIGLAGPHDVIVAVDGDGQFRGRDLRLVAEMVNLPGVDIVEGVRRGRSDPWFRIVVSIVTRLLVLVRSGRLPEDANTPCRGYTKGSLASMLRLVPPGSGVPNLVISIQSRRCGFAVRQVDVDGLPRRATRNVGTMWRARFTAIPSKRFLSFCALSATEVLGQLPPCSGHTPESPSQD